MGAEKIKLTAEARWSGGRAEKMRSQNLRAPRERRTLRRVRAGKVKLTAEARGNGVRAEKMRSQDPRAPRERRALRRGNPMGRLRLAGEC